MVHHLNLDPYMMIDLAPVYAVGLNLHRKEKCFAMGMVDVLMW